MILRGVLSKKRDLTIRLVCWAAHFKQKHDYYDHFKTHSSSIQIKNNEQSNLAPILAAILFIMAAAADLLKNKTRAAESNH